MEKNKGTKKNVRFLVVVHTDESMTPANVAKSCVYNVKPWAAIMKYLYKEIHWKTLRMNQNNSLYQEM